MKILLAILVGMMLVASVTYAVYNVKAAPNYWSYTKVIKVCDEYSNCFITDYYVECQDDRILNITPEGNFEVVPHDYNKTAITKYWCS